jgi:membrane protein DedA with SNARE-associated domain/rhodanese-related sulfurtransferase
VNDALEFLIKYGALVMLVALFIEQIGLPFPATPVLLVAGALVGAGKLHWISALGAAIVGSLVADLIWFYVGAFAGKRALKVLCRISMEPDSCVRRTENLFTRYGMPGLVGAKFVPGLSTLLPPLAGSSGINVSRFLFFDGLSAFLYCGSFMLVGFLFSNQVEQIIAALASLGSGALAVAISLLSAYIAYKYFQRRRPLREVRAARITVDELHQQQEAGENPLVLDVRPTSELQDDPYVIPGALHINIEDVERRQHEIPRDREIVLYCSCPDELGSAKIATLLQRSGITRVRPLLGGIDAWRERNYPVELHQANAGPLTKELVGAPSLRMDGVQGL